MKKNKIQSTHFDKKGAARMVDVSSKNITTRLATAESNIFMKKETLDMIKSGNHKKGDVLGISRVAGIMASKKTSELIPLCHPIGIEAVNIDFKINNKNNSIKITCMCKTINKTGIEIEALTAATVTALTIYDMCKSVDRAMYIGPTLLLHKSGGKSGIFNKK